MYTSILCLAVLPNLIEQLTVGLGAWAFLAVVSTTGGPSSHVALGVGCVGAIIGSIQGGLWLDFATGLGGRAVCSVVSLRTAHGPSIQVAALVGGLGAIVGTSQGFLNITRGLYLGALLLGTTARWPSGLVTGLVGGMGAVITARDLWLVAGWLLYWTIDWIVGTTRGPSALVTVVIGRVGTVSSLGQVAGWLVGGTRSAVPSQGLFLATRRPSSFVAAVVGAIQAIRLCACLCGGEESAERNEESNLDLHG